MSIPYSNNMDGVTPLEASKHYPTSLLDAPDAPDILPDGADVNDDLTEFFLHSPHPLPSSAFDWGGQTPVELLPPGTEHLLSTPRELFNDPTLALHDQSTLRDDAAHLPTNSMSFRATPAATSAFPSFRQNMQGTAPIPFGRTDGTEAHNSSGAFSHGHGAHDQVSSAFISSNFATTLPLSVPPFMRQHNDVTLFEHRLQVERQKLVDDKAACSAELNQLLVHAISASSTTPPIGIPYMRAESPITRSQSRCYRSTSSFSPPSALPWLSPTGREARSLVAESAPVVNSLTGSASSLPMSMGMPPVPPHCDGRKPKRTLSSQSPLWDASRAMQLNWQRDNLEKMINQIDKDLLTCRSHLSDALAVTPTSSTPQSASRRLSRKRSFSSALVEAVPSVIAPTPPAAHQPMIESPVVDADHHYYPYVMQTNLVTQWYWKNDQGQWCPYTGLSESIEPHYQSWKIAVAQGLHSVCSEFHITVSGIPERTYVINFSDMKQRRLLSSDTTDNPSSATPTYRVREVRRKSKTVKIRSLMWPRHWLWAPDRTSSTVVIDHAPETEPAIPVSRPLLPGATLPSVYSSSPPVVSMPWSWTSSGFRLDGGLADMDSRIESPTTKRSRRQPSPLTIAAASAVASYMTPISHAETMKQVVQQQTPPVAVPRSFMDAGAILVNLPPTSEQYLSFCREFMHSIEVPIYKAFESGVKGTPEYKPPEYLTTGFKVNVTQIQQVQHARRWRIYEERRLQLQDEVDPLLQYEVERTSLFHGTSWDSVDSIVQNGLNISMSQSDVIGRLWGNGVYVTPLSSFATHYARIRGTNRANEYVVLICRAVVGMSEIGSRGKPAPSQIPCGKGKRYHSTYDHPVSPFQYCLWEPSQVYVDAVVRFRCEERVLSETSIAEATDNSTISVQ